MNTRNTLRAVRIDTAPNCARRDTEHLEPCTVACGRAICLMREDCQQPRRIPPKRSLWQRAKRWLTIWNATLAVRELETFYAALKRGGAYPAHELDKVERAIAVARVNLAIAQR